MTNFNILIDNIIHPYNYYLNTELPFVLTYNNISILNINSPKDFKLFKRCFIKSSDMSNIFSYEYHIQYKDKEIILDKNYNITYCGIRSWYYARYCANIL